MGAPDHDGGARDQEHHYKQIVQEASAANRPDAGVPVNDGDHTEHDGDASSWELQVQALRALEVSLVPPFCSTTAILVARLARVWADKVATRLEQDCIPALQIREAIRNLEVTEVPLNFKRCAQAYDQVRQTS